MKRLNRKPELIDAVLGTVVGAVFKANDGTNNGADVGSIGKAGVRDVIGAVPDVIVEAADDKTGAADTGASRPWLAGARPKS